MHLEPEDGLSDIETVLSHDDYQADFGDLGHEGHWEQGSVYFD